MDASKDNKKVHRTSKAGAKANKRKAAKLKKANQQEQLKGRNPKAFVFSSAQAALKGARRKLDLEQKRINLPVIDRSGTAIETPPYVVAVVGPPKCGKTTLIRSLVKNYTRYSISDVKGPITIVAGKKRRLTFIECNNDLNSMIDTAKVADLVLLLIDASFGFEMETFEFLNVLKTHGFPKVIGILTHLDGFKNNKKLKKTKKKFKDRFWTEIYQGAKLFYLSGLIHGKYPKVEIHNLARFISVANFIPLSWRNTHPYVHIDRFEDTTNPELIRQDPKVDRNICLYGYVRGTYLKPHMKVHIPGSGDYVMKSVTSLPDPCPLPDERKKTLNAKERLLYAPMGDIGNIQYDKDAVYINIPESKLNFSKEYEDGEGEGEEMVKTLQNTKFSLNEKMENSELQLFSHRPSIKLSNNNTYTAIEEISDSEYYDDGDDATAADPSDNKKVQLVQDAEGRVRRRVKFVDLKKNPTELGSDDENGENDGLENDDDDEDDDDEDNSDDDVDGEDDDIEQGDEELAFDDDDSDIDNELDDEEYYDPENKSGNLEDASDEDDEDDQEDEENGESSRWKEKLALNVMKNKKESNNYVNLTTLIYGDKLTGLSGKKEKKQQGDDSDDELFKVKKGGYGSLKLQKDLDNEDQLNALDSSKFVYDTNDQHDFNGEDMKQFLLSKFVDKNELETTGLVGRDDHDGEDKVLFGDFEDLETGQKVNNSKTLSKDGSDDEDDDSDDSDKDEDDEQEKSNNPDNQYDKERQKNLSKKEKKIEKINAKYAEGEKDFEGDLNDAAKRQRQINEKEFESDDGFFRTKYQGFPIGVYVRIEFEKIPCEFSNYFDPRYPVIVGGLLSNEENLGMVNVNIKKHRWHKKILKSNDPLIISLGWRRFQTMMLYSTKDINGRNRMLKYTPEHMHCHASFYGPLTPPGTHFIGFINANNTQSSFRVSATGTVLDLDSSINVVKKLKLVGRPEKILKKTCFVNGMFNSRLEVAKFVGATIRTVSGIRGQIKKPLSHPEGSFRATFEDKLIPSDVIFLRTWFTVTPTKYYNPVTSLLQTNKAQWQGMKTVGQLRFENGLRAPIKQDSSYVGDLKRTEKVIKPLHIPANLQSQLPFAAKPKTQVIKNRADALLSSRAVIMEPHEKEVSDLMTRLNAIKQRKVEKEAERREKKSQQYQDKLKLEEKEKQRRLKDQKKRKSKLEGLGKLKKKQKMG